jgi:LuxR family maltose regulon positive regulatory protein
MVPPLQSKLNFSRGAGVIERPRLMGRLQSAWDYRLTLITAPPGYGKTTIVSQFGRVQNGPVIWHTVEERERDVPNLYANCLAALAPFTAAVERPLPPPGYTPTELGVLLADFLRANLATDILFILDDVHLLAGAQAAEMWLRAFVSYVPTNCHLLLLSRIVPDLPLIEMVTRREILAIGQEELRFTTDETRDVARAALGTAVPDPVIEDLAERLEGWPAGIALALQPLPGDLQAQILDGQQGPEALFTALARNMLNAQPAPLRDFLLASSTLRRMTPDLVRSALLLSDGAEMLNEVQARNLFVGRVPGGLVYHALFRMFLQQQLATEAPGLYQAFHERAALWFDANDQPDYAFDHFMAAGQPERAARIANQIAYTYFAEGKTETLLAWNTELAREGVNAPELLYRCAIIHTDRYDYAAAEAELQRAEHAFAQEGDALGAADVALQHAYLHIYLGQYNEAIQLIQPMIDAQSDASTARNIRGRALNATGLASMNKGEPETAIRYYEAALPMYREQADPYALSQFLQNLGNAYWRRGRLNDALGCLQEVVALRRAMGGASALAAALNILGYYYGQLGDYQQALTALQEGLGVLARFPSRRYECYLLLNLGDVQRNRGAYTEAASLYRRALDMLGDGEPSLRCTILSNYSTLQRWQGNLLEALRLADEASMLAERHEIKMEGLTARMLSLVAQAQNGSPDQMMPILAELEQTVIDLQKRGEQFATLTGYIHCAHVALLTGSRAAAYRHIRSGMERAASVGTTHPLAVEVLHSSMLEELLEEGKATYANLLRDVRRLRDFQVQTAREVPIVGSANLMPYHLRVYCLGQVRILKDSQPIDSVTLRRAGRDMFLYLLFNRSATREQLCELFWPDTTPQKSRQNFHTTLFRIRQVLGESVVLLDNQRYQIHPEVEVWCDAMEHEKLVRKARVLPARDARTEDMLRRAVGLYFGDFLPEVDAEWVVTRREALRESYIDALAALGECARSRSDLIEALTVFRRAAELEPYREDIHQRIMMIYAARGDKQKIVTHLSTLKKQFRRDLGAEPSVETLSLARTLLK